MIKVRCPICDQRMPGPTKDWPDFPFCSPRCRQIDLGRWLGERYRIPGDDLRDDESTPAEQDEKNQDL